MIADSGRPARIVMCAKSRWNPAIRREHAIAAAVTAGAGVGVEFIESATDVRALRTGTRWLRPGASAPVAIEQDTSPTADQVTLTPRRTIVPGHRSRVALAADAAGLRRTLSRSIRERGTPDAVIVSAPWNWFGTDDLPSTTRRVLDLTDDWRFLLPHRSAAVESWYRRIDADADEIIVVAPALARLFTRPVTVIPNAVAPQLLATAVTRPPSDRRMVYVGTLSERFDAALIADVLRLLPGWTLDLYGPSCYRPGAGAALTDMLDRFSGRARWHGVVSRRALTGVLDRADVAVLPNDPVISAGQDSMKLYDYAARGRPIVTTLLPDVGDGPRCLQQADTATSFAAAVAQIAGTECAANRAWAERNTWDHRRGPWLVGVLGRDHCATLVSAAAAT